VAAAGIDSSKANQSIPAARVMKINFVILTRHAYECQIRIIIWR
jgi:hypothetical protein